MYEIRLQHMVHKHIKFLTVHTVLYCRSVSDCRTFGFEVYEDKIYRRVKFIWDLMHLNIVHYIFTFYKTLWYRPSIAMCVFTYIQGTMYTVFICMGLTVRQFSWWRKMPSFSRLHFRLFPSILLNFPRHICSCRALQIQRNPPDPF